MESEKKRKRSEIGEEGERRRDREEDGEKAAESAKPAPSEEEVEEFFAILRRMHVAVKYFEKNGVVDQGGGDGLRMAGDWGSVTETKVIGAIEGDEIGEKCVVEDSVEEIGVLDLNSVPRSESSSI